MDPAGQVGVQGMGTDDPQAPSPHLWLEELRRLLRCSAVWMTT